MASPHQIIFYIYIFFRLFRPTTSNEDLTPQPYVVYMGRSSSSVGIELADQSSAYLNLLSSILPWEEGKIISIIQSYTRAFSGFSTMLTKKEASILSGYDEILSVFPDPVLKLHTTRSWEFLDAQSGIRPPVHQYGHASQDVIIGVIDTGIWPESPSFNDHGMGEIPSRWKGVCMEGHDFKSTNCNRKLIGARYYDIQDISIQENEKIKKGSPRDTVGHGTHTTSIAAGTTVHNASYFGLAHGSAHGGSPSSRIACYKACSDTGCSGSTILKAIDDAVKDGVDMISISIGMSSDLDFLSDPVAIGAFHAEERGVLVICSAGNDGPERYTVVNSAPWIFTVGASSIDREFRSDVVLGNGKTLRGTGINLSNMTQSKTYQLAFGETAAVPFTPASESRNCFPGSLDSKKVEGKIVICTNEASTIPRKIKKLVVEDAKAKGLILIDEEEKGAPMDSSTFPFTQLGNTAGLQILKYLNSTKNPTAIIKRTIEVSRFKPAPVVAFFSSRGPGILTENILKPDIVAPGVAILGALSPKGEEEERKTLYGIRSGTSMACPHVTGAAAFLKSIHHRWTSSMIKSALITTATITNNIGKPITNQDGEIANPHEIGVGEISPLNALNPGLVFETTNQDYLDFLCFYGYPRKKIQAMSHTKFTCPKNSTNRQHFISNINYPSVSIGKLRRNTPMSVNRVVTNVGSPNASYIASVQAPVGLTVDVLPKKMIFFEGMKKANFRVVFNGKNASRGYNFGAVTWFDNSHSVRVVFAVNVV